MEAIRLAGDRIAGLRWRSGPIPVLALHGWLDNAHSFLPLSRHLEGVDLLAIDFPGHGLSAWRPAGSRYYFDDYVFDALAVIDELGFSRVHLLGHSLGGAVATVLAAAAPERVASMVLIEGLGPLSRPADRAARAWRKGVERSTLRPRRVHASREDAIGARIRGSDLDPDAAGHLAERGLTGVEGGWQWNHDPRLGWPSVHPYTESQVIDLISAIDAPVTNILSEPVSAVMNRAGLRPRLAALRHRQPTVGCPGGHHLHMVHPDRIAPTILEHFERHA
jgi:pimeloyl-ACP methyl ester carboxylesterase